MTTQGYSATGAYLAPTAGGPLRAELAVPGSKSLTNRELVLAALASGPGILTAPLHSEDSRFMIEGLRALGVQVDEIAGSSPYGPDLRVTPPASFTTPATLDCGQAGTAMRFLTPLAGLARGEVRVTAAENALHRPMGEMIGALRDLGVDIDDGGTGTLPFTVHGRGGVRGGGLTIDASRSSQFVSGLLLSAARFTVGLHLRHEGERLPSLPHIDMTVATLAAHGVQVERPARNEWLVPPTPIKPRTVAIEPDLSNAAPFLAAALVTGGSVSVTGWPLRSTQPGALLKEILTHFGAEVRFEKTSPEAGTLTVTGSGRIRGVELNLAAAGELAPTLVGLAALADAPSVFRGIGHIREHETDRIAALIGDLESLGGTAEELEDGLRVVPRPLHGGPWLAHHDHRMATTGALIGLAVPGVEIDDIGTTAKTLPQFAELWERMLSGSGA